MAAGRVSGGGPGTYLLLVGGGSVLVEGGEVSLLLRGAEADGLRVALDGLLVLGGLEVLVALVLGPLGAVQRALRKREGGKCDGQLETNVHSGYGLRRRSRRLRCNETSNSRQPNRQLVCIRFKTRRDEVSSGRSCPINEA